MTMAGLPALADVCDVDLVAVALFEYGASVGLKLRRAGLLRHMQSEFICAVASAGYASQRRVEASPATAKQMPMLYVLDMCADCPDEVLVALLPVGACPGSLLRAACMRNHLATAQLLLDHGGELHQVEARRGHRRSLVDMATRGASLDGDWRLTMRLLRLGARAESVQAALFAPLRCGDVDLARELVALNVLPDAEGLAGLLCDVCAHGATTSAAFLLDEVRVPVNARSGRDGDTCTDRAIAWQCWETAEWLVASRAGAPAKPQAALAVLLDVIAGGAGRRAAGGIGGIGSVGRAVLGAAGAARTLDALRAAGAVSSVDLLTAAVQRGDAALVEELLAGKDLAAATATCLVASCSASRSDDGIPLVDLALCHGQLHVARLLLEHGFRARYPQQARSDALLYASSPAQAGAVEDVVARLGAGAAEELLEAFTSGGADDDTPSAVCSGEAAGRVDSCFGMLKAAAPEVGGPAA